MRKLLVLFPILIGCSQISSLSIPEEIYFYPIPINQRYGYVNQNFDLVIQPKYEEAFTFKEGYGRVRFDDNTWGFIDKNGEILFKLECDYLEDFHSGCALFKMPDKTKGFITNQGRIIAENLSNALNFSEGIGCGVYSNKWKFINQNGDFLFGSKTFDAVSRFYDEVSFVKISSQKFYCFMNKQGEIILGPEYTASGSQFSEGYAFVGIYEKKGFINKKGDFIIRDDEIAHAHPFYNGVALIAKGFLPDFVYDLIDSEGNYVREFIPDINFASPFVEGFSIVSSEDKGAAYLDTKGQFLIDLQFDSLDHFHGPFGIGYTKGKQVAFIDRNGNIHWVVDVLEKIKKQLD